MHNCAEFLQIGSHIYKLDAILHIVQIICSPLSSKTHMTGKQAGGLMKIRWSLKILKLCLSTANLMLLMLFLGKHYCKVFYKV